jgi:putative cell wall-binding protein
MMVLTVVPAFGVGETLDRIAGANRWATAVEVSKKGWTSADVVVLANGQNYPDALAGVSLAHKLGGPVLLTEAGSLVAATKAEIQRLGASKVVILGGTGVISAAVAAELEGLGLTVERISGADRFATAAAVAAKVAPGGAGTVVLAYGRGYADALAAASYAAINGYPILLTEKDSLPAATAKAIEDLGASKVLVVGGTGVIAAGTIADLPGVVRISGDNREATSVELAKYFALSTDKYFIATGDGFADAITGAVLAAKQGTGILLVRKSFPAVVGDFFTNANVANAVVFGGANVISEALAQAAAAKLVKAASGIAGFVADGEDAVKDAVVGIAGKEAKTDARGYYEITGVAPGKYTVTVSKPGHEINTADITVAQNKVATLLLTLGAEIEGGVTISGVVYDADTLAPVEALVTINKWNKETGKWQEVTTTTVDTTTSKFSIAEAGLAVNTEYQVVVSKALTALNLDDVYAPQTRTITTSPYKQANSFSQPFALKAVKPVSIAGTILDKDGEKLDATQIDLYLGNTKLTNVASDEGEYEFEDLTLPSGTYTLKVSVEDNALYTAAVAINEGVDKTHNIKLVAGYGFNFNLASDPIGTPLAGDLSAQVYQGATKVGAAVVGEIDEEDSTKALFELDELYPVGSYQVEISGDFVVTTKYPVTITKAGLKFDGRAKLAGTVAGEVTGVEAGKKAVVKLVNSAGKEVDSLEANGTYQFTGVPAGKYKVTASHPDYVTKTSTQFSVSVQVATVDIGLVLAKVATTGTLTGYLREANSGELLNGTVWYQDKDDSWFFADTTEGKYSMELAPGTYKVEVEILDGSDFTHEIFTETITVVASATPVIRHYTLTPGADASLTIKSVKNSKGQDVAIDDANYTLEDAYYNTWAPTDGVFSGLPAGVYTLSVTTPAGYLAVEQKVTIGKGAAQQLNLILVDSYVVSVPVYGYVFPGAPHDEALVVAYDANGKIVDEAVTNDAGVAALDLVAGSYTFKVFAENHFVGTAKATITKTVTIDAIYLEIF